MVIENSRNEKQNQLEELQLTRISSMKALARHDGPHTVWMTLNCIAFVLWQTLAATIDRLKVPT